MIQQKNFDEYDQLRDYYNGVYHHNAVIKRGSNGHFRRLARRLNVKPSMKVADIACGTGDWLYATQQRGAHPVGIDISSKAIDVCKTRMPGGEFHTAVAENLPLSDNQFDLVSCLGALEHFVNPSVALQEMIRIAKPEARFLFLVPNADFLTRRLGFFRGTDQVEVREEVCTLQGWIRLFEDAGLTVAHLWRDLHTLSIEWIFRRPWYIVPARIVQALLLPLWPLSWQYQIYYLCYKQS